MSKILSTIVALLFLTCCVLSNVRSSEQKLSRTGGELAQLTMSSKLDGVYELISETLALDEPFKRIERRTSSEWLGLWLFQHGRFSETLMKKQRPSWSSGMPSNSDLLGFDNITGSYRVSGGSIELEIKLSLYPEEIGRLTTLKFRLDDETLTLVEKLPATKENLVKGERITILRRVK